MPITHRHLGINKTTPLVVGVSGGPDSMALLHMFHAKGFKDVNVAHVDHSIRPESYRDAQLVHAQSKAFGYAYFQHKVNVPKLALQRSENLEAVGRDERYRFFRALKEAHGADYIVTAHHADDQVETVLLNMVRGCGLDGLGGMRELQGDLWRPLIDVAKEDLLMYCRMHHIQYVHESTNDDLTYRRNYLRHKVVPQLKKLNPSLLGTMHGNIRMWQQAADELRQRAQSYLDEHQEKPNRYRITPFMDLSDVEQSTVIRELFDRTHGHKVNLVQDHVEQILSILRKSVSGKKKEFGPGMVIERVRGAFRVKERGEGS